MAIKVTSGDKVVDITNINVIDSSTGKVTAVTEVKVNGITIWSAGAGRSILNTIQEEE